ncbi:Membrane protein involved in the export of O-antigen and teichoic acid [Cyclonatronum proteinivorum]|uniref:Membrane protein involved in the export of O-antigen and teichoic acid n=2 Tax=Cyclonatronum proteinivorum TaxID=1457365 RepID=A0A345UNZ5_9BACT|nr:Membrane protein involved in the export of O-antigen and teichoic acid [Cyclonatronum proteinivorum]
MTIARFITIGTALLVTMVLTRIISGDVYGAYRKLWLIYLILGPAFINALASTLYYRGGAGDPEHAVAVNLLLGAAAGLLTGALALFGAGFWAEILNLPGLEDGFRFFALYMALAVFAGIAEPLFVTLGRKKWLISYSIGYNLIEASLIIGGFVFRLELPYIMLLMALSPALRAAFVVLASVKSMKQWPALGALRTEASASLRYAAGMFLLAVTSTAALYADKWIIALFFESDRLYAVYEIGARKIPFVIALTSAVSAALVSEYSKQLTSGSYDAALQEARRASQRLALLLLPVLAVLFVFAEQALFLLFGGFADSAPIFRIYLLTVLTQLVFPQSILLALGRSDVNARFSVAELVFNVALSLALVMWIGFAGPALATLASHVFFTAALFGYCRAHYGIRVRSLVPGRGLLPLLWGLPLVVLPGALLKYQAGLAWLGFAAAATIAAVFILIVLNRKPAAGTTS